MNSRLAEASYAEQYFLQWWKQKQKNDKESIPAVAHYAEEMENETAEFMDCPSQIEIQRDQVKAI